jgi:hypothetical protein
MTTPLAYTTHGIALFRGVTDSAGLIPASVGVALITTGSLVALVREQLRAASGERPQFNLVFAEAVIDFLLLAIYTWLAQQIWTAAQNIAVDIYPDTKLDALITLLSGVASRFKDYSFSLFSVGAALKDSAVIATAMGAYALTLIAHWQLEALQVSVYNVVLSFGPLLLGLQAFGFNTRRLWLAAILEISSWSVTLAVVYRSIDSTLTTYLTSAQKLDFTDTSFLDVLAMLAFLTSLPFVVPIITGRLLGTQALGALGQVSFGASFLDAGIGRLRQGMSHMGGRVDPRSADTSAQTTPKAQRPED